MVTELTGSTKFGMDCVEGQVAGNDGMGRWALVTHVDTQIANELRRNPALQDMSFFTHMSMCKMMFSTYFGWDTPYLLRQTNPQT